MLLTAYKEAILVLHKGPWCLGRPFHCGSRALTALRLPVLGTSLVHTHFWFTL